MKSYHFPGFYAASALGPTVFHYRLSARSGQSIVVPARLPSDDGKSGGPSTPISVQECIANCPGDCADVAGSQRGACIANCRKGCVPPQTTGPAGPGQPGNLDLSGVPDWGWALIAVAVVGALGLIALAGGHSGDDEDDSRLDNP
jgi:hypothetical protein